MEALTPPLRVTKQYWASRTRLLHIVAELEAEIGGPCRRTLYLTAEALLNPAARDQAVYPGTKETRLGKLLDEVVEKIGRSNTGLVLFLGEDRALAVAPPFPLEREAFYEGADPSGLVDLISKDVLVGVVLLRLGRYAVGVLRGDRLVASKSGSRYVKSRHRAGGSSQRRFERSRERLVRELFDAACRVTRDVFAPFEGAIEYLLMGGERHTLQAFARRCPYLERAARATLPRRLDVKRPGRAALEGMPDQVWKSRVFLLERDDE